MQQAKPIGIDLGTTYTCAAIVEDGTPRVIRSSMGYSTIPSVVTFDEQGQPVVGQRAANQMTLRPIDVVYGSKRLLGRTFFKHVQRQYQDHFRYKLVSDPSGLVAAKICNKILPLVDVSALILAEIRSAAQSSLGQEVSRAVITVPAYYNENQRSCVREAGQRAGLEVLRIINEPTAAALCYGRGRRLNERLLVFDMGGGTFDVTILSIEGNLFNVTGVEGDAFLGGLDFDSQLLNWIGNQVAKAQGRKLQPDAISWERLREAAQEAKHLLSSEKQALVEVPYFELKDGTSFDLSYKVTRRELEAQTKNLVDRAFEVVQRTLERAELTPKQIDQVLLVGGQTRMPLIRERLKQAFGKAPSSRVHPDEAVAIGAAIAAEAYDSAAEVVLNDVVSVPIGIADVDGRFIPVIPRNSRLPRRALLNVVVPPRKKSIKLTVFQGDQPQAVDNEYLGTLVVDHIRPSKQGVPCQLHFQLTEEGILKLRLDVEGQNIKRDLILVTLQAPDDVMAEMKMERIQVSVDEEAAADGARPRRSGSARINQGPPRSWLQRMLDRLRGR